MGHHVHVHCKMIHEKFLLIITVIITFSFNLASIALKNRLTCKHHAKNSGALLHYQ